MDSFNTRTPCSADNTIQGMTPVASEQSYWANTIIKRFACHINRPFEPTHSTSDQAVGSQTFTEHKSSWKAETKNLEDRMAVQTRLCCTDYWTKTRLDIWFPRAYSTAGNIINTTCFETKLPFVSSDKLSKQRIRRYRTVVLRFCLVFSLSSFYVYFVFTPILIHHFLFLFFFPFWSIISSNAGACVTQSQKVTKIVL